MSQLLNTDDLSCNIATLVYDKYLIEAYGINSCDINYTEGDLYEKMLVKTVKDFGIDCQEFPKCVSRFAMEDIGFITADTAGYQYPPAFQGVRSINVPGQVKFEFIQTFPTNIWKIAHNLGYIPTYTILDPYGVVLQGLPTFSDNNVLIISFLDSIRGRVLFY